MSTITNSLTLTTRYSNTDFSRNYKINGIAPEIMPNVESKVEALNASLAAGTAGGLSAVLIADDFNSSTNTGYLEHIDKAVIVSQEEIPILE